MIALIHIYCSTSLCVIYKSLLIHDIQVLIYRGSTNERLPGEGVAYDSYYNETDCVTIPLKCQNFIDNETKRLEEAGLISRSLSSTKGSSHLECQIGMVKLERSSRITQYQQ